MIFNKNYQYTALYGLINITFFRKNCSYQDFQVAFPSPNMITIRCLLSLSRINLRTYTSNADPLYYGLNSHLFMIHLIHIPQCSKCVIDPETPEHQNTSLSFEQNHDNSVIRLGILNSIDTISEWRLYLFWSLTL